MTIVENGLILDAIKAHFFDLMFLDCQMPIMDGFKLPKQYAVALSRTKLPIIAMTANALEGDRERCLHAGMDDYLTKPVQTEEIQQVLERWS